MLQRVPSLQLQATPAGFCTQDHPPHLALCRLGAGQVGPLKTARGGMTYLLVAVDKFTKWIEAKPIKELNGPTAVTFIADITTRYGVPHSIIVGW